MNDRNVRDYDGDVNIMFQPDELATYEYSRTSERKGFFEPEKRLLFAVLEDAILCFQRFLNTTNKKQRVLHEDAAAWIFEPEDHRTFSFESVCEACGLDADFLRMGLRKWSEMHRSKYVPSRAVAQGSRPRIRRSRVRYPALIHPPK